MTLAHEFIIKHPKQEWMEKENFTWNFIEYVPFLIAIVSNAFILVRFLVIENISRFFYIHTICMNSVCANNQNLFEMAKNGECSDTITNGDSSSNSITINNMQHEKRIPHTQT